MLTWWAVATWAATAAGGLGLAAIFLRHGGPRQSERDAIGPLRVFPHVGLAVAGFVLWIIYAITDSDVVGWIGAIGIMLAFLIAGTFLLTREQHRRRDLARLQAGSAAAAGVDVTGARIPAESFIPIWLASGHGLLGAGTLVLVLLDLAGVGGS
jgi:hypothetical protein